MKRGYVHLQARPAPPGLQLLGRPPPAQLPALLLTRNWVKGREGSLLLEGGRENQAHRVYKEHLTLMFVLASLESENFFHEADPLSATSLAIVWSRLVVTLLLK